MGELLSAAIAAILASRELLWATIAAGLVGAMWIRREFKLKREAERKHLEAQALAREQEGIRIRREGLILKYGSLEIVDAIIGNKIWQGMTSEHLVDSWGQPEDVDTKVFKSKTSETWKYDEIGKNRFSQKIFLENSVVVGWQSQ